MMSQHPQKLHITSFQTVIKFNSTNKIKRNIKLFLKCVVIFVILKLIQFVKND